MTSLLLPRADSFCYNTHTTSSISTPSSMNPFRKLERFASRRSESTKSPQDEASMSIRNDLPMPRSARSGITTRHGGQQINNNAQAVMTPPQFARTTPTRRPQSNIDAPPAYSPAKEGTMIPGAMETTSDSPYAFLTEFDTVFLIDDSGSMAGRSWRETAAALSAITPICTSHDADGIDIYFL